MKELSYCMELVGAPVPELKSLVTTSFEQWDAEDSGTRSCALSGGATAMIFLGALRNANVDWQRITLFWADERAVPPDDPESNFGLAERMLLSPLGARAPHTIRMPAENPDMEQAARWYDHALATALNDRPL